MNENLKRLMVEADYPAPEIAQRAQKLVKLVIQECCSIANEYDGVGSTIVSRIEKHFGEQE